jgi:sugar transferase (PEP-CTERM/EpsH1 system associated)
MSAVLFLAHRLPFPPDRGDKIRSYNILAELARLGPVHVGCFAETPADLELEPELTRIAQSHCLPLRSKPPAKAGIEALLRREPVSLTAFHDAKLTQWVRETLARESIDTVYVFSGQMGQYVPRDWPGRVIVDMVDVDSAKFEAYAADPRPPMRWVHQREGRLLAREEARLAAQAECTLLVSEAEAALLRQRVGPGPRIEALGNGIDAALFDPAKVIPQAEIAATPGPHLVFTGQMDYPPNVAAALRVGTRLLPAIRAVHPQAQFHVVGREPSAAVGALSERSGCRVWGEVPDVRPYLAAADLVVAPLEIARGVQNKVLEAMAMARPVVLTPAAATGIAAVDQVHFAVAETDAQLVQTALDLLANPTSAATLGRAARQLVVETMSWPAMLAKLPSILGQSAPADVRDAA